MRQFEMIQIALARPEKLRLPARNRRQVLRRPGGYERRKACTDHDTKYTSSTWGSLARWLRRILGAAIIGLIAFGWWINHIPARAVRSPTLRASSHWADGCNRASAKSAPPACGLSRFS
jgi:hypothetical protein